MNTGTVTGAKRRGEKATGGMMKETIRGEIKTERIKGKMTIIGKASEETISVGKRAGRANSKESRVGKVTVLTVLKVFTQSKTQAATTVLNNTVRRRLRIQCHNSEGTIWLTVSTFPPSKSVRATIKIISLAHMINRTISESCTRPHKPPSPVLFISSMILMLIPSIISGSAPLMFISIIKTSDMHIIVFYEFYGFLSEIE
jgi:hypothetical protein